MNRSEQINELATALAKAQKAVKVAVKDAQNPFFKSSYADLPAVVAACKDALADNGLSCSQITDYQGDEVWLETVLMHSSGQWLSGRYPVRPVKNDPQGIGSALTYARRYSLMAMVGVVAANEDDDGNAASGRTNGGPITADQVKTIRDMIDRAGADVEKFCGYMGVGAIPDIQAKDFERAVMALNSYERKKVPK